MLFLSKICDLCTCVTERGVPMNLRGFCSKHKLVENIMVRGCAAGWGRGKAPRHQPPGRRGLGQRWLCCCWVPAAPRSHPACALQALLEKEPMDSLRTAFRQKAMETVALLRCVPSPWWQCPGGPEAGREAARPSQGCLAKGGPCPPS